MRFISYLEIKITKEPLFVVENILMNLQSLMMILESIMI